jgi:hypothetical protein
MNFIALTERATRREIWLNASSIQAIQPDSDGSLITLVNFIVIVRETPHTVLYRLGAKADA